MSDVLGFFFCCCSCPACWLVLVPLVLLLLAFSLSEKDQTKEKEKKVKKTIPAWATLSASQLARAQKQTQMAATSRPKMDAILTEAIKVSRTQIWFLFNLCSKTHNFSLLRCGWLCCVLVGSCMCKMAVLVLEAHGADMWVHEGDEGPCSWCLCLEFVYLPNYIMGDS